MPARLKHNFFRRDPVSLAKALLGQTLVRQLPTGEQLAGTIVETEAYLGVPDKAAHTYNARRTPRNEAMYLDAGHAYVYFTYGMHHCLNITADRTDTPTACLLRALHPTRGLETMKANRSRKTSGARRARAGGVRERDLCSGPAKLAQALGIDLGHNGIDLVSSGELWLERGRAVDEGRIAVGPRVGVGYASDWADKPLRFWVRGNEHVSRG